MSANQGEVHEKELRHMTEWSTNWRQELDQALTQAAGRRRGEEQVSDEVTVQFCLTSGRAAAERRIGVSERQALTHRVLVTAVPSSQNGESVSVYYILHGTLSGIRQYLDAVDWELSPTACR